MAFGPRDPVPRGCEGDSGAAPARGPLHCARAPTRWRSPAIREAVGTQSCAEGERLLLAPVGGLNGLNAVLVFLWLGRCLRSRCRPAVVNQNQVGLPWTWRGDGLQVAAAGRGRSTQSSLSRVELGEAWGSREGSHAAVDGTARCGIIRKVHVVLEAGAQEREEAGLGYKSSIFSFSLFCRQELGLQAS